MPSLTVVSSLLDAVMNELRIPVSNLTERTKIQAQMSYVYGDICAKQDWWWLQRQAVRNTMPKIDTGTVDVTEDSNTLTFSTAPQQFSANVSVEGYIITLPGNTQDANAAYRIISHTSGTTTATIDGTYTGATETGASFKIYQTSINIPSDVAKLTQVKRFGYASPLQRIGIEDLNYLLMTNTQEGKPQVYSVFDFTTQNDTSTKRLLQLWPYPDRAYRLELWYKHQQQGTLADMDLPIDFQQVLVYGTLSRCYPIFLNDLDRGQYYLSMFNDVMALMAAQQREYASDHPGIRPSADLYRRTRNRRRWPGTLGHLFDTLPNVP